MTKSILVAACATRELARSVNKPEWIRITAPKELSFNESNIREHVMKVEHEPTEDLRGTYEAVRKRGYLVARPACSGALCRNIRQGGCSPPAGHLKVR